MKLISSIVLHLLLVNVGVACQSADPLLPPPTPRPTPPPSTSSTAPVVGTTTSCYRVTPGGDGVPMWAQCGGQSYKGSTMCVSGGQCVYVNEHFSSCQPIPYTVVRCS
ncbi:hypothetical protein Hypma_000449 [Hypsizygus marmoreus]|uniref:CBM1 domain-containing protein n=1 Tax=Hypsizygus marmoreus TaxID=39966 RepID=A0A369JFB7_HYPMA|nr:hypothetical protein Hypma_000449 [Hypsizygus marmoreus]